MAVLVIALFPACASHLAATHETTASTSAVSSATLSKPRVPTPITTTSSTAPPARPCRLVDLAARLGSLQGAGQSQTGGIAVWNTSSTACQLRGPVSFAAYYSGNRRDPNTHQDQHYAGLVATLPPHGIPTTAVDSPQRWLAVGLVAPEYRADGGMCYDQVARGPSVFVIGFDHLSVIVPNRASGGTWQELSGCSGGIAVAAVVPPTSG